jgi:hypothetical protein
MNDLMGTWDVTSEGEVEEGVGMQSRERVLYSKDATFSSNDCVFMTDKENGVRLMTVGGNSQGTFEIKEGKLHVKTTKMGVDFFASLIPDFSRETFDEIIQDTLNEVDVYTVVSITKEKIVIRSDEDGMESVMTRFIAPPKVIRKEDDPTRRRGVKVDLDGERYRWFSMTLMEIEGFSASKWLPTWKERSGVASELRKKQEVLDRLMCCYAAVAWVTLPEDILPSERLQMLIEKRGLKEHFTDEEKEILGTNRNEASQNLEATIGWRIENMWALAWALGFDETPDIYQEQVGEETIGGMFQFLAPAWDDKDAFLEKLQTRNLAEVVQIEDLFYCTHNAVRSAQAGKKDCVPEGFHPMKHGGIIHEKRHALTWLLSPGVEWDDTDLST